DELSPQNPIPNPWELNLLHDDGDPRKHENDIKPFFCYWAIFQRCANRSAHHGPDRFSLLYICADGVAVFRSLYIQNAIVPKAIAIIQPGHGFGGNWTNFEDHEKVLGRSVLNDNLGGGPEFLLNGGAGGRGLSNDCNCWPDYKIPQAVNDDGSNFLGNTGISIWKNINMLCTCNNILV
ncbi:MAG: hypothetical protein OXE41_02235, partial [Gammaproteobacteria bacterium]|nr:hypothetical protein [Gammaproteobacteria bacterium]